MSKKTLTAICCIILAVLMTTAVFIVLFSVKDGKHEASAEDDLNFRVSLMHIYAESDNLITVLPFTAIQLTQQAIIKALKNDVTGGINYLESYVERTVTAAYKNIDNILDKYSKLFTKYGKQSDSKYTALKNDFAALKASAESLITKAKTLMTNINSASYSTYYNQYMLQLTDLSEKASAYLKKVQAEYELLYSAVLGSGTDDIKLKKELLDWYEKSDDIVNLLPFTTMQVTQQALIMALKGDTSGASDYLNNSIDRTLDSAYKTMDGILEGFSATLTKYKVTANSSYRTKLTSLTSYFQSMKSSGDNLIGRTKSLIKVLNNGTYSDEYYTQYMSQLEDFYSKMENYLNKIQNEYDSLLSAVSVDYNILK